MSIAAIQAEVARRRRNRRRQTAGVVVVSAALAAWVPFAVGSSPHGTARLYVTPLTQPTTTGQPTAGSSTHPTLQLSWSGQPRDGATATVSGAGFSPGASMRIVPCIPNADCSQFQPLATVKANSEGSFSVGVTAHLVIDAANGGSTLCAQNCKYVAASDNWTVSAETVTFDLAALPPASKQCPVRTLQLIYDGPGTSKSGSQSAVFHVRNTGTSSCWVYGPGEVGFDSQPQLPASAWTVDQSPPAWPPKVITLQAGDTAQFTVTKPVCTGASVTSPKLYFGVAGGPIVIIEVPIPSSAQSQLALCANVAGAAAGLPAPENVLTVTAFSAG